MKILTWISIVTIVIGMVASCNNNSKITTKTNPSNLMDYKETYGSSHAILSEEELGHETTSGPLAYAPNIPALTNADTVEIRMDVQHKKITVADGVQFWAWAFGDSVPGPVIRVQVGQIVKFKMSNRSIETARLSPPMPHSIDFHGAMVNPQDKYQSVAPGQTISFEWTANYPGVFTYHCGTPIILEHMIYGMVGMLIVVPKDCLLYTSPSP